MPFFDFKCEECGEIIERNVKWSKTMAEDLEPCKCGAKKWKRQFSVSHSKFAEPDRDIAVRQTNEMMSGKGWL